MDPDANIIEQAREYESGAPDYDLLDELQAAYREWRGKRGYPATHANLDRLRRAADAYDGAYGRDSEPQAD
jgi:hypothetical protein